MPNHCMNTLYVNSNNREDMDAFIAKMERAFDEYGTPDGDEDKFGKFTFAAFVPPTEVVLNGVSGYGTFIRQDGVWERTTLTVDEAREQGHEVYSGRYGSTVDGLIYTAPEMEEAGLVDWYTWNVDNWGTKWDAYEVEFDRYHGDTLEIRFESAWSPPTPVVRAMQKQHPELYISMEFDEPNMLFRGAVNEDGSEYTEEYEDHWDIEDADEWGNEKEEEVEHA